MSMITKRNFTHTRLCLAMASVLGAALITTLGCAVNTSGMTLPNPDYQGNRVQFFAPGTEFPFPNEAAQLMDAKADQY